MLVGLPSIFFKRKPQDVDAAVQGRDVFNEKPPEEEVVDEAAAAAKALPAAAILHTSLGDITLRLHGEAVPRTVENFSTHAKNGYFDSVIFHRVIRDFMIQTGALLQRRHFDQKQTTVDV